MALSWSPSHVQVPPTFPQDAKWVEGYDSPGCKFWQLRARNNIVQATFIGVDFFGLAGLVGIGLDNGFGCDSHLG